MIQKIRNYCVERNNMTEIWKNVDDRYSVSNLGRVKSNYANKERFLKPFFNHCGYLMVDIRHPNSRKSISVHRLVAMAFIPNPDNLPEVNHKDEDKTNNCVENLEWCDTKYNCNYGTRNQRKAEKCKKQIISVDKNGNIKYYASIKDAAEQIGIDKTSISKALSYNFNKNKTAGDMLWFYDDIDVRKMIEENNIKAITNKKNIYSIDKDGNIEYYISISEAQRQTGINNINRSLKNGTMSGGRHWFYDE